MLNKTKLAILPLIIGYSISSQAGSINTSFNVTATVEAVCQALTADNIDFGNYDTLSGASVAGLGDVSVTCSNGTAYAISLSSGASGSFASRNMQSGGNTLNYNLYTDNSHTSIWGDGTSSTNIIEGVGTGSVITNTVFGEINANQTSAPGAYSDTITVTVDYL